MWPFRRKQPVRRCAGCHWEWFVPRSQKRAWSRRRDIGARIGSPRLKARVNRAFDASTCPRCGSMGQRYTKMVPPGYVLEQFHTPQPPPPGYPYPSPQQYYYGPPPPQWGAPPPQR